TFPLFPYTTLFRSRMFTETVRPVGVEPVKDALEILRLEAGPFIFHANDDAARLTGCDDMNRAARRGEGKRIVDQVTDDLTKPRIKALYRHLVPARRTPIDLERDTGVARRTCLVEEIANGFKQGRNIHVLALAARQLGVKARSVGNIADETINAAHIILDDLHQAFLLPLILRDGEGFNRAAQRGQRVLDLMGDIGCETLNCIDAAV